MTTETQEPAAPATPPTPEPTATDRLPDDHPAAKALAKANKEAENLRLKLQEIEDRDKSEVQRLTEAVQERDTKLADLPSVIRRQVLSFASAAQTRGFLDPEDALAFMPNDVDLSDAAAVGKALDDLAGRKPHLVRAPKKQTTARPKAKGDVDSDGDEGDTPKGKERAAAALRQFRNT